ncbi:MAG: FAD-dependent oxidoreductase [Cyanobacteria bacterium J06607_13]
MWDVAIIGAGLAGLTCARSLRSAGAQVCIVDKSKGLGGRLATRRVSAAPGRHYRVDHGARYWQPQSAAIAPLTQALLSADILAPWKVSAYELQARDASPVAVQPAPPSLYCAPNGMSAIAKYLARDFTPEDTLLTDHRVTHLNPVDGGWKISCADNKVVMAKRCALAVPAAQAAGLLATCPTGAVEAAALSALRAVKYDPCLTVMSGYRNQPDMGQLDPGGWMITDTVGTSTDWIGLDSSKRRRLAKDVDSTVIVIHSKPAFARQYLDVGDLQLAASVLLRANARKYCDWIAQPQWFQIHRWRYAQVKTHHPDATLMAAPSLVCGGDWCKKVSDSKNTTTLTGIDTAYLSGLAMAERLQFLNGGGQSKQSNLDEPSP